MLDKYILNVGVVGCGRIASSFDDDPKRKYVATHIGAYKNVKRTKVIAICDVDKYKLKECLKKWNILHGYTDFREMLKSEKLDILSVCTPPGTHYPIIKKAVKSMGLKAIFCEKPIADSLKDAEEMVRLCKQFKILLQIDHQRRFDPLHNRIRNIIKNKILGSVQQANFYYTAGIKNTGSHMFDLLMFFFGEPQWLEAFFSKSDSSKKGDPNLDGLLKFKNNFLVTFQACNVKNYFIFELNCFLEKGRIVIKNSGFSSEFYKVSKNKYFSGYNELFKTAPSFNINYKRNFMVNAVKHLLDCLTRNKKLISSGEDGLAALRLVESAIYSAKNNGKRVFLN